MANIEYISLRALATYDNAHETPSDHPCNAGNGSCCFTDLEITGDDVDYIISAVANGEISENVVKSAIMRGKKMVRIVCPFLDNQRRCTIYNHRPLVCIATGFLMSPRTQADADKLLEGEGLPYSRTTSSMCHSCHRKLEVRGCSASYQSLVDSQSIFRYLGTATKIKMRKVVKVMSQSSRFGGKK